MKARILIVRDLTKENQSLMQIGEESANAASAASAESSGIPSIKVDPEAAFSLAYPATETASMEVDASIAHGSSQPRSAPIPSSTQVTTIIDDDEMEDLFGPATGSESTITSPLTSLAPTTFPPSIGDQPFVPSLSTEAPLPDFSAATGVDVTEVADSKIDFSAFSNTDYNALLAGLGSTQFDPSANDGLSTDLLSGLNMGKSGSREADRLKRLTEGTRLHQQAA